VIRPASAIIALSLLAACMSTDPRPLDQHRRTPAADISLKLPAAVVAVPALYANILAEEGRAADTFAARAARDLAERRAAGFPARRQGRGAVYVVTAQTPRLLSLRVATFTDTGGAHPNTVISGFTWDRQAGRPLVTADFLADAADLATADRALCDAIHAEKRRRAGAAPLDACPNLARTRTALAPSTVEGKAGGLTVLFSPYDIGAYVEGAYLIEVPYHALRRALAPEYASEFAGAPRAAAP
jgi:hypothetical protein